MCEVEDSRKAEHFSFGMLVSLLPFKNDFSQQLYRSLKSTRHRELAAEQPS